MLEANLEMDEEGMTVPYPPFFDEVRKNHGFIDIRGTARACFADTEGLDSLTMRTLLIELAQPS